MYTHNNKNTSKNDTNKNNNNSKNCEKNKRPRNHSFSLDNSSVANKSKKLCDLDSFNSSEKLSFSIISEFEYFQLNLNTMKKLELLNSTEMDVSNEKNSQRPCGEKVGTD